MNIPCGTTPTFTLIFTDQNLDLTEAEHVFVNFKGMTEIEKQDSDLVISAKQISVFLSQEETLSLSMGRVAVQANWTYSDGTRAASNIVMCNVSENLLRRAIE